MIVCHEMFGEIGNFDNSFEIVVGSRLLRFLISVLGFLRKAYWIRNAF